MVTCVGEFTVNVAATPLKATAVVPVRLVPVITTGTPTGPLFRESNVIVGGVVTVNTLELVALPPSVRTVTYPEVAPAGTTAVI